MINERYIQQPDIQATHCLCCGMPLGPFKNGHKRYWNKTFCDVVCKDIYPNHVGQFGQWWNS